MTTLGKSAAALVACAAAAFSWWAFVETSAPPSPVAASEVGERVRPVAAASLGVKAAERELVPTSKVPAALDLRQPFAFELRARVVDADGLPMGGAHLAVAPPGCALALSPQQTDANGCVAMTWQARVPALTIAVGLAYQGSHTALQELRVVAGTIAELHFVGGNAPMPAQVRIDELGRQIVTMPDCAQGQADCRKCHAGLPGVNLFTVRGSWQAGLHPDAVFGDRLAVAPPNPAPESAFGIEGAGHFCIAPSASGFRRGRFVEGRVFGADGKPAAGVRVQGHRPNFFGTGVHTNADGTFRLPWPKPGAGSIALRAGGGPEGLSTRALEIADDGSIHVDLILETGRTLCGRALGADGAALNGARVEFVGAPGGDSDLATVGPDGAFAFANLPPGPARLLLWGVRGEKLPIAEERAVPLAGGEVVFDLRRRPPARGGLRLFVRGHDGEAASDLEVRAWQIETGRGTFLDRREDGGFHLHGLMAGFYRLEVGALMSGFVDLGQHWVDGAGLTDLGTVQLPQPARLRIDAPTQPESLEFYARRTDLDVRADTIVPWARDLQLPAGRWLAMWKQDGNVITKELALTAGATTQLVGLGGGGK